MDKDVEDREKPIPERISANRGNRSRIEVKGPDRLDADSSRQSSSGVADFTVDIAICGYLSALHTGSPIPALRQATAEYDAEKQYRNLGGSN